MAAIHRERVLRAATSSFLAHGYGSSVDHIARRARVAKQTVYQHFASKDELFKAVAEELAKRGSSRRSSPASIAAVSRSDRRRTISPALLAYMLRASALKRG
ncbi:MAG TPA: helix-turn-helix domain-containing protein, partial [Burkholderiales bacterium]|nr:helix-turn-helix domain-containing protein [Burkholderiales bacterium]